MRSDETAGELKARADERRRIVGLILTSYGRAIERGDKITAEILDALATEAERG